MKNAVLYVHGKGGNAEEANRYKHFFDDSFEIIGFDYKSLNPWDAKIEFINYLRNNNNNKYFKKWVVDGNNRGYGKQEKLYWVAIIGRWAGGYDRPLYW